MDEKIKKRKQKSRTQLEQKKHGNSNVMKTQLIFFKFKTNIYNCIHQSWYERGKMNSDILIQ